MSSLPGIELFENTYECPCGNSWTDTWSCACDDECSCGTSCGATASVRIEYTLPMLSSVGGRITTGTVKRPKPFFVYRCHADYLIVATADALGPVSWGSQPMPQINGEAMECLMGAVHLESSVPNGAYLVDEDALEAEHPLRDECMSLPLPIQEAA